MSEERIIPFWQTSVIVNSVSENLLLDVGQPKIATSIYQKGGKEFQDHLIRENPDGVQFGQMVVSPSKGNLKCDWVFNCCLEGHKSNLKTEQVIYNIIVRKKVISKEF